MISEPHTLYRHTMLFTNHEQNMRIKSTENALYALLQPIKRMTHRSQFCFKHSYIFNMNQNFYLALFLPFYLYYTSTKCLCCSALGDINKMMLLKRSQIIEKKRNGSITFYRGIFSITSFSSPFSRFITLTRPPSKKNIPLAGSP